MNQTSELPDTGYIGAERAQAIRYAVRCAANAMREGMVLFHLSPKDQWLRDFRLLKRASETTPVRQLPDLAHCLLDKWTLMVERQRVGHGHCSESDDAELRFAEFVVKELQTLCNELA